MTKTGAYRLHVAAILSLPPLRITFYLSLLSSLAAAGVKAAGSAAERQTFALWFSPFSLFFSCAEFAVLGKWDTTEKNEKSDRSSKNCRTAVITIYVSCESFLLPLLLTQNSGKGGISPYMAMPGAFFTNLLMAHCYQRVYQWLYGKIKTPEETTNLQVATSSSSNTETLLPESDEGLESTARKESSEIELTVLPLPQHTGSYHAFTSD